MNKVLGFVVGVKDLVTSKEFVLGFLIGGGILVAATVLHILVRL